MVEDAMAIEERLAQLAQNAHAIAALAQDVSAQQAGWKPTPEEWSILEVVCHLHDEEREDFRRRVDLTVHRSQDDWPAISPQAWVTERMYNQRALGPMLDAFLEERTASLEWLRSLVNPDWDAAHTHPIAGMISARQLLDAWVAHDHLHIRQLNHLHWQWLAHQVDPVSLEYAGGW
jgi:hypothetical protein